MFSLGNELRQNISFLSNGLKTLDFSSSHSEKVSLGFLEGKTDTHQKPDCGKE